MAKIHFRVETRLAPAEVLRVLTDFGEHRADVWPNIDAAHFQLHELGPGRADVTEGSSIAGGVWERERYEWDAAAGRVSIITADSNTWGPGSRWDYALRARSGGGTDVDVQVVRNGKGAKGRLVELVVALAGSRRLRGDLERVLARAAAGPA
jgi:hypothetical protein